VSDRNQGGPPEYKVYRSRKNPLQRLSGGTDLDALKRRLSRVRKDEPDASRDKRRITPGRVLKWIALAIVGWILLSLVLFLISAQIQDGVSPQAERALSDDGNLLTGSTILVLGSDARTGDSIDESQSGPSRADSIMLVHASLGSVRKLSIPRDIEVQIPGHGTGKINAAYAFGGPALTIETVEGFLGNGLQISHLVEVDFEDFPELIDSLGGVTVNINPNTGLMAVESSGYAGSFAVERIPFCRTGGGTSGVPLRVTDDRADGTPCPINSRG
jgi:hypothetical protein